MTKEISENVSRTISSAQSQALPSDFIAHVRVRWSDIDVYQHINNAKMVTLLEESRVDLITHHGVLGNMVASGMVVADITVKYKAQLRLQDSPLQVVMWVSSIRASDFILEYRVYPKNVDIMSKPAVIAQSRMVAFSIADQCVRRLTDDEAAILQKFFHE